MEFLIDLRFEDKMYNALIHFVATFKVKDQAEAKIFVDELLAGFQRRKIVIYTIHYYRIDHDEEFRSQKYDYCEYIKSKATAKIQIEQFFVENPDQNKSLVENLMQKFFEGENSIARIGNKYNLPVIARDLKTRNPIPADFYYFTLEHLIPKN
jgi:hypothetical protein